MLDNPGPLTTTNYPGASIVNIYNSWHVLPPPSWNIQPPLFNIMALIEQGPWGWWGYGVFAQGYVSLSLLLLKSYRLQILRLPAAATN